MLAFTGTGVDHAERGVGEDFPFESREKGLAIDFLRVVEGERRGQGVESDHICLGAGAF